MGIAQSENELSERTARYLKAELKRSNVTYEQLAELLKSHGLSETRDSVASKLKRGRFPATFLIAVLAALQRDRLELKDL